MSKYPKQELDDVVCICPKCRVEHVVKMLWIGGCQPRKFCPDHQGLREKDEDILGIDYMGHGYRVSPYPTDQGYTDF